MIIMGGIESPFLFGEIMNYNLIMAMDLVNNVGKDDGLPWKQSTDLKRFKELTDGHTIVMGRKTFESIGKPLPNRVNLVVTSDPDGMIEKYKDWAKPQSCESSIDLVFVNFDDLEHYITTVFEKVFFIGGRSIWDWAVDNGYADYVYLTMVHSAIESLGNVKYENSKIFNQPQENIVYKLESESDKNNDFDCTYLKIKMS